MLRFGFIAVAVVTVVMLGAGPARAEKSAGELFDEAMKARNERKFDVACPLFEKSYQLDPKPGALYTLAVCESDAGWLIRARNRYKEFLRLYDTLSVPLKKKNQDRMKIAKDQLAWLATDIPKPTLTPPQEPPPPGTRIILDEKELELSALGRPLEMDPGDHVVRTEAPGRATWESKKITLAKGALEPIKIEWPAFRPSSKEPVTEQLRPKSSIRGRHTAAIVVSGVGVAGLVAWAITGGRAISQASVLKDCVKADCPPADHNAMWNNGNTLGNAATVSLSVGLVGVGVGAYLWYSGRKRDEVRTSKPDAHLDVAGIGQHGAIVGLRGSF